MNQSRIIEEENRDNNNNGYGNQLDEDISDYVKQRQKLEHLRRRNVKSGGMVR